MQQDVRWKQRFSNFEKTIILLEKALQVKQPDIIYRAGIIQCFEMSIELAWKTLKDYFEEQKFTGVNTPKAVIKKAFETGLIQDGHRWMDALENRNLTVHTYDEEKAIDMEILIQNDYFPLLNDLYKTLKEKI